MDTLFVADVLARPSKNAGLRKLYEYFGLDELPAAARSDDEKAALAIEKKLKDKYFSIAAFRVHKVDRDTRKVSAKRPTPTVKLTETVTDKIIRDFDPFGAAKWRTYDDPTIEPAKPRGKRSATKEPATA